MAHSDALAPVRDCLCTVLENRELGGDLWLLRLRDPKIAATAGPGAFVMVDCDPAGRLTLRRPFSIQRVRGEIFELLYRRVGRGTDLLSELRPGQELPVLGPLGNRFTLPTGDEYAVLIGGGVGIPPMVAIADALVARDGDDARFEAYLGVRGPEDAGCRVGFDETYGDSPHGSKIFRATMDGSLGFRGHALAAWIDRHDRLGLAPTGRPRLYACGPMVMLRAVAAAARQRGIPCEVSVETMMGCGVGVCMGCVIENADTKDPKKRAKMNPYDRWKLACTGGPVFDANTIVLDDGGLLH